MEPRAAGVRLAAGRLVVYTPEGTSGPPGVGLHIYTRDGRRLVRHLLGNQALDIEVAGGRAYGYRRFGRARALHVVNARSGEVIRRVAPPPRGYDIDILGG